jgi:CheY-like chemotaxis protein
MPRNSGERHSRQKFILMVDDDAEDRYLAAEALKEIGDTSTIRALENGEQLLQYLRHEGSFSANDSPRPDLILLDLNMPIMDGHEALRRLRDVEELRDLPIVVFSTSRSLSDINKAYRNGANTYVVKPQSFDELCRTMESLRRYWFEIAETPDVVS